MALMSPVITELSVISRTFDGIGCGCYVLLAATPVLITSTRRACIRSLQYGLWIRQCACVVLSYSFMILTQHFFKVGPVIGGQVSEVSGIYKTLSHQNKVIRSFQIGMACDMSAHRRSHGVCDRAFFLLLRGRDGISNCSSSIS